MEFLGIGPLELLFVILIALIVIGPKDMSKTARSAGRFLNKMYRSETWRALTEASRTLQTLPNRLAREAQLEELDALRSDLEDTGAGKKVAELDPALKSWVTPYTAPDLSQTIAPPNAPSGRPQPDTKQLAGSKSPPTRSPVSKAGGAKPSSRATGNKGTPGKVKPPSTQARKKATAERASSSSRKSPRGAK